MKRLQAKLLPVVQPMAQAMQRLDQRQQETALMLQELLKRQPATAEHLTRQHQETLDLMVELLNSLQPTAEEQIDRAIGPLPLPTTYRSSES